MTSKSGWVSYTNQKINFNKSGKHDGSLESRLSQDFAIPVLCLSRHNKRAPIEQKSEYTIVRTKEFVCRQNKDYGGGATC